MILREGLKTREITEINKECVRQIRLFETFSSADGAIQPTTITFPSCGYDFKLVWNYARKIWILEPNRPPPTKGPKGRPPKQKARGSDDPIEALPERVKRPRKKFMERKLCVELGVLCKKVRRSQFGHALTQFLGEAGTVRQFGGIFALGRAYDALQWRARRMGDVAPAVIEALDFTSNKQAIATAQGADLQPRFLGWDFGFPLMLATWVCDRPLWDQGLFGERVVEREQMRA